jgi:hypothetical protein
MRPTFRVILRPTTTIPPEIALRRLLKRLLRQHGFVCVDVAECSTEVDHSPARRETDLPGILARDVDRE